MNISKVHALLISNRRSIGAALVALSLLLISGQIMTRSTGQIVVAKHLIAANEVMGRADLELVSSSHHWPDAITSLSQAIGHRAVITLGKGQPISKSNVAEQQMFDPQTPGAVKITLPNSSSSADLEIGTRVDVYAQLESATAKIVISNALVIATGKSQIAGFVNSNSGVSLAVSPNQVQQVANYGETAKYTFVTLAN